MKISEALDWAASLLIENDVEGPKSSARVLLCQVLKKDIPYLFTYPERELSENEEKTFSDWVKRRAKHEPVWYIAGNKIDFYGQEFYVDANVLIPRPETELMIEMILDALTSVTPGHKPGISLVSSEGDPRFCKDDREKGFKILDIGTGSGAIILSLANEHARHPEFISGSQEIPKQVRNDWTFYASDISDEALEVAKKNADKFGLEVDFRQGDLFDPWKGKKFDLVVTNLPYIPHEDIPYLDKDLTDYEPMLALDGGKKGLEIYNRFFEQVGEHVNEGAKIYCEIGHDQGESISEMAKKALPGASVRYVGDYSEKDRIVIIELSSHPELASGSQNILIDAEVNSA